MTWDPSDSSDWKWPNVTEFFARFTQNAEEVTLKLVEKKVDIELEHERQVSLLPSHTAAKNKTKNILLQLSEI